MKRNKKNYYPSISSFEEFRYESERLSLKGKLLETRMMMNISNIKQELSVSGLGSTLIKDLGLAKVSGFIEDIINRENR